MVRGLFRTTALGHILLWPVIIIGGSITLLLLMKGLMVALQYHYKASYSGSVDYD
ncbi:hypothetical protein O4H49_13410 [Kiloniella laminariae]|uniref:Uncharacterized protein n=1 Tax=Kiloniella laminariae TaxID=454162 RepID=A0ABT4LKZ9_9PROT|nr:hypothetical protein [Kiloniella laminariae]MCZ4281783.1 hypothetical protein [Kiloniella laminariae]